MCWNAPVSAIFGLFGLAAAAFLFLQGRRAERDPKSTPYNKAAKWHALFVGNIAMVEVCEFFIWLKVIPMSQEMEDVTCPALNKVFTYGVFIFGFANWMWVVALWAYKSSDGGNDQVKYQMWLVLGVLTFVGYIARIVLGDGFTWGVADDFQRWQGRFSVNASIPTSTCSFQETGKYPHLHWRFNLASAPFLPSGWAWFATGLIPLFFYKPFYMAMATGTWGVLSYAVPVMLLPVEETMSFY